MPSSALSSIPDRGTRKNVAVGESSIRAEARCVIVRVSACREETATKASDVGIPTKQRANTRKPKREIVFMVDLVGV